MKKTIPYNKIPLLAFPDFEVFSMTVKLETKEIRIETEGAIIAENSLKLLGAGFLSFKNWKKISIREFSENKWAFTQDTLREICEFLCEKDSFILKGFGKSTGQWIEYTITEAMVEAQFDEAEQ